MPSSLSLRTGAWYGDQKIELEMPGNWDVNVLWPKTPPPITEKQINEYLQQPIGQASISKLCKGKSRPLILVDDLNRPTPTAKIMPHILGFFADANIPLKDVTILMATGSHGKPAFDAMRKKIGEKAVNSCQLVVHDCFKTVKIGKTSFGTPVYVNPALPKSDFIMGIGGIYPNHTAGFGGGSKLVLGALGIQSIFDLHFCHRGVGWGSIKADQSFRKDLDEIANMVGLRTSVSLHIDADREIVRIDCGDPLQYYSIGRDFAAQTFTASSSRDANVIISNAYPNDLSMTFVQMKGFTPFFDCKSNSTKIAIASCNEGIGLHNIFPFLNVPRFHRERQLIRRLRAHGLVRTSKFIVSQLRWKLKSTFGTRGSENGVAQNPVWLFRPGKHDLNLPQTMPGIALLSQWSNVLETIKKEQQKNNLKVAVYPCAFLQLIKSQEANVK